MNRIEIQMAANNYPWNWDYENFRVDSDFPFAISQTLWDEWAQSLLASTPSSQIIQQPPLSTLPLNNEGNTDPAAASSCYQVRDLCEESPRCKRRRMLLFAGNEATDHVGDFEYGSIGSNSEYDLRSICEDMQLPESTASSLWFSDEQLLGPRSLWQEQCPPQQQCRELRGGEYMNISPPLCDPQESQVPFNADVEPSEAKPSISRPSPEGVDVNKVNTDSPGEKKKAKLATPVLAYPFAVLKPSGVEGAVTLNDINKRILMPPARPIQHPVGVYAKPPSSASTGSGISGKAVVALTKIHTQGKGTITIMRTKG